jgi:hypothetical protein
MVSVRRDGGTFLIKYQGKVRTECGVAGWRCASLRRKYRGGVALLLRTRCFRVGCAQEHHVAPRDGSDKSGGLAGLSAH